MPFQGNTQQIKSFEAQAGNTRDLEIVGELEVARLAIQALNSLKLITVTVYTASIIALPGILL